MRFSLNFLKFVRTCSLFSLGFLCLSFWSTPFLSAQEVVPPVLSFQGQVSKDGEPLNDPHWFKFSLVRWIDGSKKLVWPESEELIEPVKLGITDGVFTYDLEVGLSPWDPGMPIAVLENPNNRPLFVKI